MSYLKANIGYPVEEKGIAEDKPNTTILDYHDRKGKGSVLSYLYLKGLVKAKILDCAFYEKFGCAFSENNLLKEILNIVESHPDFQEFETNFVAEIIVKRNERIELFMDDPKKIEEIKKEFNEKVKIIKNLKVTDQNRLLKEVLTHIVDILCRDENLFKKCMVVFQKYEKIYEKRFDNHFHLRKIRELSKELKLSKNERMILEYMLIFPANGVTFNQIFGWNNKKFNEYYNKLVSLGLIIPKEGRYTNLVAEYIENKNKNKKLSDFLFTDKLVDKNDLDISDYPESMQQNIKYVVKLIKNHKDVRPLNILFYGVPGAGKSSLVNLLKETITERSFYAINNNMKMNESVIYAKREADRDGDESHPIAVEPYERNSAKQRMSILNLCDKIAFKNKTVFVMDECDDVLNSSNGTSDNWLTGKKEINELLQSLKVPVIWITNHKNKVDTSTFRRFQYSIKFEKLSFTQRKKIWQKQIAINNAEELCKDLDLQKLAMRYEVSPGIINSVVEQLIQLKPEQSEVCKICEDLLKAHCELVDIEENTEEVSKPENEKYDISGLNIESNFSLSQVLESLDKFSKKLLNKENKNRNMNVLLEGVPGVGKTEFAKYISRYLERPLIYRNYGDLSSCWVGETEHNIARIFKEAEETGSVLFLDEADSLFQSREKAFRSWEVTEVNEILTRMERFQGIFVASTNFLDNLDKASLRRFAFKIKFKPLDNDGKVIFLKRFFNVESKDYSELYALDNLTPGDFKAVRDRLTYLDMEPEYKWIVSELKIEVSYKNKQNRIGF